MFERMFRNGRGLRGGGRGQGGGNKAGAGPGGECRCPKCGHTRLHEAGQRCLDTLCPKCGMKLVRA